MSASRETGFVVDGATTERAVRELRHKILRGELLPGEQLRQEELAGQLLTSRVPVREALSVLANEGLLTHRKRQGYFVTKRSAAELAQIRLMLGLLEQELAKTLSWPSAELIGQLRARNDQMAQLAGDAEAYLDMVPLNHDFHLEIFGLSPLNLVLAEVRRLWALADPFIALDYGTAERRQLTVRQHEQIIQALASHDRPMLLKAIHEHRESTNAGARATLAAAPLTPR
jgi:DNA-binding GntR family transcriptional regulator